MLGHERGRYRLVSAPGDDAAQFAREQQARGVTLVSPVLSQVLEGVTQCIALAERPQGSPAPDAEEKE